MVETPWKPEAPEQLPEEVQRDIAKYAAQFKWVKWVVSVQLVLGLAPLVLIFVLNAMQVGSRDRSLQIFLAFTTVVAMGLGVVGINSRYRWAQMTVYSVAQVANAMCMVLTSCFSCVAWFDHPDLSNKVWGVMLLLLDAFWIFGFVWMVQFHHRNLRIQGYREQYHLKPKKEWEVSPWANFEAPLVLEEMEVSGDWDEGGEGAAGAEGQADSQREAKKNEDDWGTPAG